jgi:hypothetical protein
MANDVENATQNVTGSVLRNGRLSDLKSDPKNDPMNDPKTVHRARKALAVTAAEVVRMPLRKSIVRSPTVRPEAVRLKPAARQKDYMA